LIGDRVHCVWMTALAALEKPLRSSSKWLEGFQSIDRDAH
jgi:hypothetical protein